jgi:alcohol dehydrogenase
MYSHCRTGGWILGHLIDGTQAEFVRIPHADTSLYRLPADADEEAYSMLSDIFPTSFECGVLNGQIRPGDTEAIVGAGPIGLAALLTAQMYSPAAIVMVDIDQNRLDVARSFGATATVAAAGDSAVKKILDVAGGEGVDVAIEAMGIPATFDICQSVLTPGGRLANVGVHGKSVELHLEKLWHRNITITTRLVDTVTTPTLLKMVTAGRLDVRKLVTHRFALSDTMKAYDTFGNAAKERALKVVLKQL